MRASATEAMAPMPCTIRPNTSTHAVLAVAHTTEPTANNASPRVSTGRRPHRSLHAPNGTWNRVWVSP